MNATVRSRRLAVTSAGAVAFAAIVGYLGFVGVSRSGANDQPPGGRINIAEEIRKFNPPPGSKGTVPQGEPGSYVPLSRFPEYIAVAGPLEMSDENGIVGYMKTRDFDPIFWTEQRRPPVPVYAADLVTIVGTFDDHFVPLER
jgi:hypothetical protein